jgi:hypothetical protein
VYDNDKKYMQLMIDSKWYRIPTSVGKSMIFKEVGSLDITRAMRLGDIETTVDSGVVTIRSKFISGRYRMSNVVLNGQRLKVVKLLENIFE